MSDLAQAQPGRQYTTTPLPQSQSNCHQEAHKCCSSSSVQQFTCATRVSMWSGAARYAVLDAAAAAADTGKRRLQRRQSVVIRVVTAATAA